MENEEEQYQKKLQQRYAAAMKKAQQEEQRRIAVKSLLDTKAFERLMNIRVSNPDLYSQLVNMLLTLAQANRIQGIIDEAQLKSLLERITFKKEPTIEFKHK